jgi:hypothetical protein
MDPVWEVDLQSTTTMACELTVWRHCAEDEMLIVIVAGSWW